jgi:serine protease Do
VSSRAGIAPLAALLVALFANVLHAQGRSSTPPTRPAAQLYCSGEYADDLQALATRVREYERHSYSYCVRNTATYECLSYGTDGNVKKTRKRAVLHGTAFAYKQQNGETLLLTNDHVAEWPPVTDDEHPVEGVPHGCKRVADAIRVVDNESDAYERDDVALSRVVTDDKLDVAVLKAHTLLPTLPWKIGRSASLRERNVVEVRGFPLGAFQATNVGKVISAFDHDSYHEWDHDDFVVDALLSSGNSGSPVLAVSCKTGQFELVGIYHAGYAEGSALNVVVGIDQVRDLMTTLKRTPRIHADAVALGPKDRAQLSVERAPGDPFFPFGALTASVRPRSDGALLFEVMSRDFPLRTHPIMVIEDLPAHTGPGNDPFGELGRIWFGGPQGLKTYARTDLDAETQAQLGRVLDLLRHDAVQTFAWRVSTREATPNREKFDAVARLERTLRRNQLAHREPAQNMAELAERLGPHNNDTAVPLADAFVVPPATKPEDATSYRAPPGPSSVPKP